ncbi:RibD family protein [Sediminicoccus rosea]|uniref:RibD family protein n=1 Tax=Sediminicoccus rosea TaxID=1225128 RepID=A0ABZ0PCA5_9PROT|nr:RibD family protein [Sediminicoccus rosea]WPB83329.1 RibD family protein [Sediminicoccus rosea]
MEPAQDDPEWTALREGRASTLAALFGPLLAPPARGLVIGRLAQTLDGRIATRSGNSKWIGGAGDLRHTHRLRALCDAVIVGAGTVRADDPLLTTRLCAGPSPVRVVIDAGRRLGADYGLFREGPPTLLATVEPGPARHGTAEALLLPRAPDGGLDLAALLDALTARGLRTIFVEGGGQTVSGFLRAGLLDRLHVTVAPMILGSGRPAFDLPEVGRIEQGMRFTWTVHDIAPDVLFDIALDRRTPSEAAP